MVMGIQAVQKKAIQTRLIVSCLHILIKIMLVDLLNYKIKYKGVKYHLMKFIIPNDSRVQISDYHEGTVDELIDNISKWLDASTIYSSKQDYQLLSIYRTFKRFFRETKIGKAG